MGFQVVKTCVTVHNSVKNIRNITSSYTDFHKVLKYKIKILVEPQVKKKKILDLSSWCNIV